MKHEHQLVDVDLARGAARRSSAPSSYLQRDARARRRGRKGMNPDVPETKILDNPYKYTDYRPEPRTATEHGP